MKVPATKEEFISRHSAYFQSIGFDEQFAAFIYYMLDLGYEDSIHYEYDDDFVIDRVRDGFIIKEYYQVKHSKYKDAKITDADTDFWKTVDNWIELYKLSSAEKKKVFFVQGKFIILTNKIVDNKFYRSFCNLQNGVCEIADVINDLNTACSARPSYKTTIEKLIKLGKDTLNQFLHKIKIIRYEDFLESLYEQFLLKYQRTPLADQILKDLIGTIWQDKVQGKPPFEYTGEQFIKKYKGILERVSYNEPLSLEFEDEPDLEEEDVDEAANMIDQLKSVEIIGADSGKEDFAQAYYLGFFFKIKRAIESFKKQQIITNELVSRLDKSAIGKWSGIFIKHHYKVLNNETAFTPKEKVKAGSNTLTDTLDTPISVTGYDVDSEFSKGWYLRLSNCLKITWHYDWFKKYMSKK